jgi:hypothetical protein
VVLFIVKTKVQAKGDILMKSRALTRRILIATLINIPLSAKRPPKPPKPPRVSKPLTAEQKQAVVGGVAQIMGGVCNIVQDPHNPHHIGSSIAQMLQGLITIIVEKLSNRNIDLTDTYAVKKCLRDICHEMHEHICEIAASEEQ